MSHEQSTPDAAAHASNAVQSGPRRDEVIQIMQQIDQHLTSIQDGSAASGRWLDKLGNECAEQDPEAIWEPYTAEEQAMWLDTVVAEAQALKQLGCRLRALLGIEHPAPEDVQIAESDPAPSPSC